jgi:hypothetical protein
MSIADRDHRFRSTTLVHRHPGQRPVPDLGPPAQFQERARRHHGRGRRPLALRVAHLSRPIVPGPAAIDFVNQPAAVDNGPLLERMPRRLTPFIEGLATYLAPESGPGEIEFDTVAKDQSRIDAVDRANV